ncbi:unnamed protein product, partial [Ectocarpus sp. 4 AP-2014]
MHVFVVVAVWSRLLGLRRRPTLMVSENWPERVFLCHITATAAPEQRHRGIRTTSNSGARKNLRLILKHWILRIFYFALAGGGGSVHGKNDPDPSDLTVPRGMFCSQGKKIFPVYIRKKNTARVMCSYSIS